MSAGSLADRVIAVAGVGGGLGPLVAGRLAAEGAVVAGTDRSAETLAALPEVIDALRARGFGFATVSELLGYRLVYRPYG